MNHLMPPKIGYVGFEFTTALIVQQSLSAPSVPFLCHLQVKALIVHTE